MLLVVFFYSHTDSKGAGLLVFNFHISSMVFNWPNVFIVTTKQLQISKIVLIIQNISTLILYINDVQ